MPHLVATLIYLSQIYSYYISGDMSPLKQYSVVTFYAYDIDKLSGGITATRITPN